MHDQCTWKGSNWSCISGEKKRILQYRRKIFLKRWVSKIEFEIANECDFFLFQGVNKHNGETVAVKTFNQLSHMRPQEVQMREFEVLQKVKHENIVKLLAIEEEQEGRGKVIVMELCTGGSLFNLLDDPENNFGLDEDEWLLVLSHLSAGMNHLRDNNLVHRYVCVKITIK